LILTQGGSAWSAMSESVSVLQYLIKQLLYRSGDVIQKCQLENTFFVVQFNLHFVVLRHHITRCMGARLAQLLKSPDLHSIDAYVD